MNLDSITNLIITIGSTLCGFFLIQKMSHSLMDIPNIMYLKQTRIIQDVIFMCYKKIDLWLQFLGSLVCFHPNKLTLIFSSN